MLQKLSNGAKGGISKFILVGFLFMAVAGLVLTDVGGFFRDGISSTSVADVGSEPIPYHEFDRFLRNALAREGVSPQEAHQSGVLNQILRSYAQDILFVQKSKELGIQTPDKAVAEELHRFVQPYVEQGTTPQEALDIMLNQQGITEENFVNAIRRDLTSRLLRQALSSGLETSPTLLSLELGRFDNEYRNITFVKLPHSQIEVPAPTEEDLEKVYNAAQAEFRIPERRAATIGILNPETLVEEIDITEEDLATFYENNKERFSTPSGRKAEQAVFPTEQDALSFIETYKPDTDSFESLAGGNYRTANVYQEDNAPEPLQSLLFNDDEATLKGPVQSPFGWHVIHDLGNVEKTYQTYEEVKDSIKVSLERDQRREIMIETLDVINDRLDEGEALEPIITEFKMEALELQAIDQFGLTEAEENGLASFERDQAIILETLFDTYEDEPSELFELADGRFAVLNISNVIAESVKPFETVKDQISERLVQNKQRTENSQRALDYLKKLRDNALSLEEVSKENNLTIETAKDIKRSFKPEDNEIIPIDLKARIFVSDTGKYVMSQAPDGIVIATSSDRRLETPEENEELLELARRMAFIDTMSTYINCLSGETPIRVNQRLLDQLYGPPQG